MISDIDREASSVAGGKGVSAGMKEGSYIKK